MDTASENAVSLNNQASAQFDESDVADPDNQVLRTQAAHWQIEELDKAIVSTSRKIDAATYDLLIMLREFDERGGWVKWGSTSCAHWLSWRCDLSYSAAREKMRVAHALKILPETSTLFARGELSYSKVRAVTRTASRDTEPELLKLAAKLTAAQLEQRCRQRHNASPESSTSARQAMDTRFLRCWRDEARGMLCFRAELPLEDGLLLEKALDKATLQMPESSPGDEADKTNWQTQQVDALTFLGKAFLSEDGAGTKDQTKNKATSTADHYQVVLHVDEKALSGNHSDCCCDGKSGANGDAQIDNRDQGESQLPVETIRRLCCDGSIVPIIENSAGDVLNVGRKQRIVPTAIRRALHARDGGCAFPGCSHTRFLDAHHIKHWADNGETSLENTMLLCSTHHRLVHEGRFKIARDEHGKVFFRRTDGKAVPDCGYSWKDWSDEVSESDAYEGIDKRCDSAEEPEVNEVPGLYVVTVKHRAQRQWYSGGAVVEDR